MGRNSVEFSVDFFGEWVMALDLLCLGYAISLKATSKSCLIPRVLCRYNLQKVRQSPSFKNRQCRREICKEICRNRVVSTIAERPVARAVQV